MSKAPAAAPIPTPAPPAKKRPGRTKGATALTVAQKAEAATLWRMGEATLEDLAKKFKKRPETFSRLFKKMGIEKGSGAKEAIEVAKQAATTKVLSDTEKQLARTAAVKASHFNMARGLAQMAWSEIVRAKQAGLDIAKLKDLMTTLKLAGDVIGNSREKLYILLGIEEHDKSKELEDLPDLTIRELTPAEIVQIQETPDDTLDSDGGAELLPDEDDGSLPS